MSVNIITKQQVKGKIEILAKDGSVESTEEIVLEEVEIDKPMANVGVKLGATVNLGDYNSRRVDVSLYMPSETDRKSLDKTFKKALKWCDKKVTEIIS
jgi:hypothetical protein